MENLTIKLRIDGKEKKFVSPDYIPGTFFRKAGDFYELLTSDEISISELDPLISFVCEVFENKFTIDEFEEGTDSRKIVPTILATVHFVMNNVELAAKLLGGEVEEDDEGKSD